MKDKLTIISDDLNHDIITELEARKQLLNLFIVSNCKHENEIMRQGDGFVYGVCDDCGKDLY
jgi:hypothetical protein